LLIALPIVLIAASIGVYYLVLRPNSITGASGGVEGIITDELGRAIKGLRVIIIEGSVGFPEIAAMTNEDGYYQIRSIPPGTFTLGVHDEEGEMLAQKTFQIESGKTSTVDITLQEFLVSDT
jgi:hypothetical protein